MAVQEAQAGTPWHEIVVDTLKRNSVRLVTYVPDNVLKPLIKAAHADGYFTTFPTTREEEAVGIVAGACMAGMRGIVLMQTSGFGTLANVIASLPVAFQIQVLLMICTAIVVATIPAVALAAIHILIVTMKAANEERFLLAAHGAEYADYRRRTGRFLPRLRGDAR